MHACMCACVLPAPAGCSKNSSGTAAACEHVMAEECGPSASCDLLHQKQSNKICDPDTRSERRQAVHEGAEERTRGAASFQLMLTHGVQMMARSFKLVLQMKAIRMAQNGRCSAMAVG